MRFAKKLRIDLHSLSRLFMYVKLQTGIETEDASKQFYADFCSSSPLISFLNPLILAPIALNSSGIRFAPNRMTIIKNRIMISVKPKLPKRDLPDLYFFIFAIIIQKK